MYTITIDRSRCKKDGLCASVCPEGIFVQREKLTVPELVDTEGCIACGHCVAICPQDAIFHSEFPSTEIRAIQLEEMPTTEQVMALLKTRRASVVGFSCSADRWVRGFECTIGAAECLPCRPRLGDRALLRRLGSLSLLVAR